MYLGAIAPTQAQLDQLIENANRLTAHRIKAAGILLNNRSYEIRNKLDFLSYFDYLRAVKGFDKYEKQLRAWDNAEGGKIHTLPCPSPAIRNFIERGLSARRTLDEAGWKAYVDEIAPGFAEATRRLYRSSSFPEEGRARHTLIVAPTGWGKSELLKAIVHHDIHRTDTDTGAPAAGLVFLDPHGVASRQIARWPELIQSGRLVYVEPGLAPGLTVGINPFAIGQGLDYEGQNTVAGTVAQVLADLTDDLSPNMGTLTRFCALVLLGVPDATLRDLGLLLQRPQDKKPTRSYQFEDDEGDTWEARRQVVLGAAFYHHDPEVRGFFRHRFDSQEYLGTRGWIIPRIDAIAAKLTLRQALFGRDTLDLKGCMDAGKIVIVNLERYGNAQERADMGRLLVGMVAAIGSQRDPELNPRPVHVLVDEATEMVSPRMVEILERLRKFAVHLTLAQQVDGRAFTPDQRSVLATNTRTKIIASTNKRDGAASLGHDNPDELPTLSDHHFWVKWHGVPGIAHLVVRPDLIDWTAGVSKEAWLAYVAQLVKAGTLYRPAVEEAAQQAPRQPEPQVLAPPTAVKPAYAPLAAPQVASRPDAAPETAELPLPAPAGLPTPPDKPASIGRQGAPSKRVRQTKAPL